MATPHNSANKGDIAKTVIMPGDPKRAEYIAETYLDNYKLVNDVRGMKAYTGYYKGKELTIMAHGMGIPSVGIYTYELFKFYDVDNIIRIGTCGAYTDKINLKDVILETSAYTNSNYAMYQSGIDKKVIDSDAELNKKIEDSAKKLNIRLRKGIVYSSDVFYSDVANPTKLFNDYGCLAVEMESFGLFYNAKLFNKKASCILTVSDSLITKEEISSEDRQTSLDSMIVLALESAI